MEHQDQEKSVKDHQDFGSVQNAAQMKCFDWNDELEELAFGGRRVANYANIDVTAQLDSLHGCFVNSTEEHQQNATFNFVMTCPTSAKDEENAETWEKIKA